MNTKLKMGFVVAAVVAMSAGVAWAQAGPANPEVTGNATRAAGDASVYIPIQPCRIVDTRLGGGGKFGPGDEDSYRTYDTGTYADQGGKAGNCGIDGTVSIAIEASVTAVGPQGTGYFRAYPSATSAPSATFLNYNNRLNTTNTGAISVSSLVTYDLTVQNFGGVVDYVIDVQGYYANIGQPAAAGARAERQASPELR